ncbi:hypothetical protein EHQ76_01505 [Leptospira barantonii]|uniref:Uncharacterized protein n=1 Tax=Leptospira barantonii TaxID=2023184 RepID=A0A5F2BUA8_9LEPT|nr:hypothetical protein [Leptospira barantonii]TGM09712.1 hypothetical protein EHQ76_01505 [Leptospira barantonii]
MNGPGSFQNRIEQTEGLISFLSEEFPLELKSSGEEWPREYEMIHLKKKYKALFSIFGSFTLIPADANKVVGTSPIYYLSLDADSSQQLVWTKPDGEIVNDRPQIVNELKNHIQVFESGISQIKLRETPI